MHFDPRWRQEFAQTRSSILQSCEGWIVDVQHIGSTAISGLVAQPIIDCVAAVDCQAGFDESIDRIVGLNFKELSAPSWLDSGRLLVKPRHGAITHRIFVVLLNSPPWHELLRVRDRFLADPEWAVSFEEAKVASWKEHEGDREQYEVSKQRFFAQ